MTEPPWVPGPNQKPPPFPEFVPPVRKVKYIPWKIKISLFFVLVISIYLVVGLAIH